MALSGCCCQSRSLSRIETQDIKTQPQFNHYFLLFSYALPLFPFLSFYFLLLAITSQAFWRRVRSRRKRRMWKRSKRIMKEKSTKGNVKENMIETRARPVGKDNVGAFFSLTATTLFPFAYSFFIHSLLALKKIMLMSRHGGANRILS